MENIFRLKTFHGTKLFQSPTHGIIHADKSDAPEIFAQSTERTLVLFSRIGDQKKYFYLDDNQQFVTSNEPVPMTFLDNDDGSITITSNEKFLSARKYKGLFSLMPNNKDWEHLTLEALETEEMIIPPVPENLCAGCTACAMACPKRAITMVEDDEGFMSPSFNPERCIKCGRCERVCPIKHQPKNPAPEITHAAWIKDEQHRADSSSGGLGYALAASVIERGGVVCGATLDGFVVKHIIVDKVEDLRKLQGSKYVQSDLGNSFVEIKKLLKSGRQVLFIGTPCQVAGLKNFVHGLDSNLLAIDFICHGVPSPGVLRRYVEELRQRYPTAVTMSFRDKVKGWNPHHAIALYDENARSVFRESGQYNAYIRGFLKNVFCRRSCSQCPFTTKERVGDITLGDYWGIKKIAPKLNSSKGVSLTVVHTEKGKALFDALKEKLELSHEIPYDFAVANQAQLRKPSKISVHRKKFFQWMRDGRSIEYFLERAMFPVGILNFHFANSFGAVLVAYSLQKVIGSFGYKTQNINFVVPRAEVPSFIDFREKYLSISKTPLDATKLKSNNLFWKRVVVGSDQVWRMFNTDVYMCAWASGNKSLISYAASFGKKNYVGKLPKERAKTLLGRFDFISVREDSGVNICKNDFGVEAVHVIDPTMLLPVKNYDALIDPTAVKPPDKPYVCLAFINIKTDVIGDNNLFGDFRDNYVLWNALRDENGEMREMSTWLTSIRDADYIITDSFHVTAFSILFNKQFVSIVKSNGLARIPSLLNQCGIPLTRIYGDIKDISLKSFEEKIDYDIVNKMVAKEREKGRLFIKMALAAPPHYKKPVE